MRLLFVSNLFPNAAELTRGIFNAQQAVALSKECDIKVIAPMHHPVLDETWQGITVMHPRFIHIPVLSRPFNGWLFARAIEPAIRREQFDIVLASWAYPDAYGVMLLARKYGFPFATDVLGSDVNVFFENSRRRQQILSVLRASSIVFAKSKALVGVLANEGIESVIDYNGIDRERFRPLDRGEACRKLGLATERRRILYVGNLLPVKGPVILASAARRLPDVDVIFVGSGTETIMTGHCVGARPHEEIPLWMNACDVLCLPSLNEGLPNVVLEAMACGLPVVASRVGGVPEVVRDGINGFLVSPSNSGALADALHRALSTKWDCESIRASVSQFNWDVNARTILATLERVTT